MPPGHVAHVSATTLGVRQVARALDAFCSSERVPEDAAWRLRVAVDEVVANIVSYGTTASTTPEIDVRFRRDADAVEITITDDGPPFDPLAAAPPDLTAPVEQRRPGGLGILLVKNLMDEVLYTRTTGNVITLRKRIA